MLFIITAMGVAEMIDSSLSEQLSCKKELEGKRVKSKTDYLVSTYVGWVHYTYIT